MITTQRSAPARLLVSVVLTAALAACGGGGGGTAISADPGGNQPSPVAPVTTVTPATPVTPALSGNTRITFASEASGSTCPDPVGGVKVTAFVDENGDGVLGGAEVSSVRYVCYSPPGAAGRPSTTGLAALIGLTSEPAGSACPLGGRRVALGLDTNSNGTLDASEVTSSVPLCSTATVTAGGSDASLALVDEARGATCASAGKKITTSSGGTSTDSYLCYAAPGLSLMWKRITAAAANLAANFGHIIVSVTSGPVTLTLPVEPGIKVNDTITVRGESANAWTIAQNAGQTIGTRKLGSGTEPGALWTAQDDPAVQNWWFVASSASGMKLAAVSNGSGYRVPGTPATGSIWTSTNAGKTWLEHLPGPITWASIASSADGNTLAAAATYGGLWTSYDSGNTWIQRQDNSLFWVSITMSSDGMRMAAVDLGGLIHTSTDAGKTWVGQPASGIHNWRSIASSGDGLKLVAVAADGESPGPAQPLYVSTDAGVTWAPSTQLFTSAYRVASSRDGTKVIMAERFGKVWTSADSGVTWINRFSLDGGFNAVASSADGTTLIVVAPSDTTIENVTRDGVLRVSTDSGATWTPRASTGLWRGAAISADGNLLFAAINNGVIYRSIGNRTTYGTAGSITGGKTNDITLRYLGDGLFDATNANGPAFTIK